MSKIFINNDWEFTCEWSEDFCIGRGEAEKVRIPHTVKELPYNYTFEKEYQMLCGYRRVINYYHTLDGRRIFVNFGAAAHVADVYINGEHIAVHECGYTAFDVELTGKLKEGANILAVKLNTSEQCDVPPFGFVIDYLTYGGIYRDVSLRIEEKSFIGNAYPMPVKNKKGWTVKNTVIIDGDCAAPIKYALYAPNGKKLLSGEADKNEFEFAVDAPEIWDLESPAIYRIKYAMGNSIYECKFGFRTAEFKTDGFYLNDKKVKIRGLNRHQSFAYVGYAMPDSMQANDADILKNELGVNLARTSHYPQSHAFLDRCDELGLLVFTEIPGWQHIGGGHWKDAAVKNTEEMVMQYRCHPSIVLWGVRINESLDDDEFYKRTNAVAHRLDPSRQTSGVRYLTESSLLEDVYAHNDFSYSGGSMSGLKTKKAAVGKKNVKKGYIVSEYNGHMYPTKDFDCEEHRLEHALRHAAVLDSAAEQGDISGCIGWCMFDYNTHRDFGSGDRICYHGVMDMFRNPKLAASVYASQSDSMNVLEVGSSMEIGEHPAGNLGDVWCFTNADSVKLYKNGAFVKEFKGNKRFSHLPHPPMLIDDFIGELIEQNEGFGKKKSAVIKECLQAVAKYGMDTLPTKYKLKLAKMMIFDHMTMDDATSLYGKYVANWGGEAVEWRFDAIKDGKVVKTKYCTPASKVVLTAQADKTILVEGKSWDAAAIRISARDDHGNLTPYYMEPLTLAANGCIELIGPSIISLKGGCSGTYVRTTGAVGKGSLTISSEIGTVTLNFETVKEEK